jgi:membrane glycosyltransferase
MTSIEHRPRVPPQHEPAAAFLPERAPHEMPTQSLRATPAGTAPAAPASRAGPALKRLYIIAGTAALTALAAYEMYYVLEVGGITVLEALILGLFVLLFAWVGFSFLSSLAGFVMLLTRRLAMVDLPLPPSLASRTALLFPVYNEQPDHVLGRVRAMLDDIRANGVADRFDLFLLSDTTDPDIWILEEQLFLRLRETTGAANVFYRHRARNVARKSGNIQDWVSAHGAAYDFMVILDADSLMTTETLVRLAGAMERLPHTGLIQTLPIIINARTTFARLQQFAGRLYGPLIAAGIAWWHGTEGNYWGHNAIIRVRAFAHNAGLPELSGRKPFGGHILSHDFIEAALMRRGGWAIMMAPALRGSYEECPPSLLDYAARDRRWCQGNLQHLALLRSSGLHWVSRLHLMTGIGSYLTAPMWFGFLVLGISISLQAQFVRPEYFPPTFSLFPKWPAQDPVRAIWVFAGTMLLLILPKLLAFVALLADRPMRQGFRGGVRTFAGILLETILSGLMAPVMMIFQSRAVSEILLGRDSGWQVQQRADGGLPRGVLIRQYTLPTVIGALMAISAFLVSTSLLAWMTPVIAGLLLCIPIAALVAAPSFHARLCAAGLLATPEDTAPDPIIAKASLAVGDFAHAPARALDRLRADPVLREAHLANLPPARRKRGEVDPHLATAMAKVDDAETFDEAAGFLDPRETFALLGSPDGLSRLMSKP